MITCRELVDFLMDFDSGELPPEQARVFQEHLTACPPCLAYLESYRETVNLGTRVCADPEGEVPDDCPEELVRAILKARQAASG